MATAVDAYRSLDIGPESEAAKRLMDNLPSECGSSSVIDLTKARYRYDAKVAGGLTPAMAAWCSARIAGPRGKAIAEIESGFQREKLPEGSPKSTFLEVQRDEVRARSITERIEETVQFLDHNRQALDRFSKAQLDFNTLKTRRDREPVKPRPILYAVLLAGLVLLEAALNFESLLKVPLITSPILATAATISIACLVASAAHLHGIVLKQWNYLFSPQDPSDRSHGPRRSDAARRLVFGGILLALALAIVAGARYYYLRDYIMQARILGSAPPSMVGSVTFMLFGNIAVYLVATLVSYYLHDADPNYAEKYKELRQSSKVLEALKRKRRLAQAAHKQGLDNALAAEANQAANTHGPNYAALRVSVDQLVEKDQEVIALLSEYRLALVRSFVQAGEGDERRFCLPEGSFDDLVPVSLDRLLTPREFAAEHVALGFSSSDQ